MANNTDIIDVSDVLNVTFELDDELVKRREEIYEYRYNTLREVHNLYVTTVNEFLNKLRAEPGKNVLKWPSRSEDIERFQQKLIDIDNDGFSKLMKKV